MNWAGLYSERRTGDKEPKSNAGGNARTSFQQDYDRIVFSSAFRRLQNKTQVFPLPRSVFVHNRLTHSLEVASVGRSLGKVVGDALADKYPNETPSFKDFYKYDLPLVVSAACLAHDIGNPPFGHSGEDAIRTFFNEIEGDTKDLIHQHLTENQLKDFERFEGNSNALRTLTNNFNEPLDGGYRLTYTTLAAIVKYPCTSAEGFNKATQLIATKKSGFFDSELAVYKTIADTLGIPKKKGFNDVYARHPFVYLTEAADDICYRIIDMEDAHRLGIVSIEKIKGLFLPFFNYSNDYRTVEYLSKKMEQINDANQKVQYIRANWIGLMVEKLSNAFIENEEALLAGTLEKDLLACLPPEEQQLIDKINDYSVKYIYNYKSVVEVEIAGYNLIGGLLKEFVHAVLHPNTSKSKKILQLIPQQFPIAKDINLLYADLQSVVDFIAGMTDLYAIDLYRKITGISIPEIK